MSACLDCGGAECICKATRVIRELRAALVKVTDRLERHHLICGSNLGGDSYEKQRQWQLIADARALAAKAKPYDRRSYDAGLAAGMEAAAKILENGHFLHDDAPPKRFATEAAAAIRREIK